MTSLLFTDAKHFVVGTSCSNVYTVDHQAFEPKLTKASHNSKVNDICFPEGCSDLFATGSDSDVRVWNIHTQQELLRVSVPNVHCLSVVFCKDGSALITGRHCLCYGLQYAYDAAVMFP